MTGNPLPRQNSSHWRGTQEQPEQRWKQDIWEIILLFYKKRFISREGKGFLQALKFRACIGRNILFINPIPLELVPIWHPLLFSLYLRHGFCSESEDVEANRVKLLQDFFIFCFKCHILLSASMKVRNQTLCLWCIHYLELHILYLRI